MIHLSIITINRNNSEGLRKTMQSVLDQGTYDYEYIVVDGASSDGSVSIIKELVPLFCGRLKWVSEVDSGIYNAMNKGIAMATGEYIQVLNSGDVLASPDVVDAMLANIIHRGSPSILYGNMIKHFPDGKEVRDMCFAGQEITMIGMYSGTLNHNSAYIRRALFDKYGLYDESLRICADWAWFLKAIVFGNERTEYFNYDVTVFDMTGISENERYRNVIKDERSRVLSRSLPDNVLADYDSYSNDIYFMRRLRRHGLVFSFIRVLERVIFKFEKMANSKKKIQRWG